MTSYKVAFIKTNAFQKKVAGKNYYEGYDNQVEGSAPIFNFYFTEDYNRSWDSGNPFSYSSLRNGEIESIDYDSSKLTVKFLNYDTFSYEEKVYEVGVPTTDEKIVDPSDHSKLFEFTPTEIFVGDSLNSNDPITETMRDSVMEFEQNKGKIPKMAETFEARTTRKSRKWGDKTGKGNIEMKPDGKQSGLRGYDRSPKGTSDAKLDWDSANDANTKIKANLRGKEDLRDFKKYGMAEYVACAECGDDVYELESNTCCEECNDNLNEAFEWIAKENGEENLRDFMDSIDITDDDLNAETFEAIIQDGKEYPEWESKGVVTEKVKMLEWGMKNLGFTMESDDWLGEKEGVQFNPPFYVEAPNGNKVMCQFIYDFNRGDFFVLGDYYRNIEYDAEENPIGIPTFETMQKKLATYGFHHLNFTNWNDMNTLIFIEDFKPSLVTIYGAETFEASDGWVRSHSKGDLAWDVSGLITFIREKPFHFEKQFTMPPYPNTLEIIVDGFFTGISYEDLDPEDFNASLRKQYVSYWTDEKLEEMLESSTMELVKVFYEEIADEGYFGDTDEEEFPECDWCGHEECICEEEDKAEKEKYIMKEKTEHEKWKQEHIKYCDEYFVKQMKRYMKENQNTWFLEDVITDEPMFIPTYIRFSDKTIGKTIYEYKLDYEGVYGAENEVFNANAKSGDKVYIITRRCEDYSAYRELDMAVFGSKTEAKKKFNYLFKEEKEQNYPDETIADAKSYMRWGEVGWGIESFMADDMLYELREQTIGKNAMSGFYFDAEGDSQ